jgi:hypothetical protein
VDFKGRFILGRVIVVCPRGTVSCHVIVHQVDPGRLRILPLAFDVPAGRSSKIRLRLTADSLHALIRARRGRAAVLITARQGSGPQARKRVAIRLLAPRHEAHRRHRLHGRALMGRPLSQTAAPGSAGRLQVGISEQGVGMFADPRFKALGLKTARLVVPWNAIWTEPGRVGEWLRAASADGVEPLVAFDHDRGDRCPSAPCALPSVGAYEAAVRAFLAAYPQVRLLTPWNEANHAAEPTAGRPDRAADYYNAARRACAACTLVAGDVIDGQGMLAWLAAYRSGLDEAPAVWGLHDYYDTTYFRTSGLEELTRAVDGEVWLTETGGIVGLLTREGRVSLPRDELRARASVSFAFEAARAFSGRVGRLYLYQWQAEPQDRFDAGLVRADGSARPALEVVREQAAALADMSMPATGAPNAVPGRVTIDATGAGGVRLRCPGRARCVGRLWIEDARLATVTLINGRLPGYVLRPLSRAFNISSRRAVRVRFNVLRSVLDRAWTRRQLGVRLMVASPAEPFALRSRYRVDAWRPSGLSPPRRRAR